MLEKQGKYHIHTTDVPQAHADERVCVMTSSAGKASLSRRSGRRAAPHIHHAIEGAHFHHDPVERALARMAPSTDRHSRGVLRRISGPNASRVSSSSVCKLPIKKRGRLACAGAAAPPKAESQSSVDGVQDYSFGVQDYSFGVQCDAGHGTPASAACACPNGQHGQGSCRPSPMPEKPSKDPAHCSHGSHADEVEGAGIAHSTMNDADGGPSLLSCYGRHIDEHLRGLEDEARAAVGLGSAAASSSAPRSHLASPHTMALPLNSAVAASAANEADRRNLVAFLVKQTVAWELHALVCGNAMLHRAVAFLDQRLAWRPVGRARLPIVGAACFHLASKVEDVWPLNMVEMRHMFSGADPYAVEHGLVPSSPLTVADVVQEEATLLQLLDWSLHVPTSHTFLVTAASPPIEEPQLSTASYLCELALLDHRAFCNFKPSTIAAAAISLSAHAAPRPPGAPAVDAPARELQACISRLRGAAAKAESSSTARGFYIGCAAAATAAPPSRSAHAAFSAVVGKYTLEPPYSVHILKWLRTGRSPLGAGAVHGAARAFFDCIQA